MFRLILGLVPVALFMLAACESANKFHPGVYQIKEIDQQDTVVRQYEFRENGIFEKRLYVFLNGENRGKKLTDLNTGSWKKGHDDIVVTEIKEKKDFDLVNDTVKDSVLEKAEIDTMKVRSSTKSTIEIYFHANEYGPSIWEKWEKI